MSQAELVVDLRAAQLASLDDFWDAVQGPCGLPDWFGRNLDAWWDVIENRGISETIDGADLLVVQVTADGLFAAANPDGARLAAVFRDSSHARLDLRQ